MSEKRYRVWLRSGDCWRLTTAAVETVEQAAARAMTVIDRGGTGVMVAPRDYVPERAEPASAHCVRQFEAEVTIG